MKRNWGTPFVTVFLAISAGFFGLSGVQLALGLDRVARGIFTYAIYFVLAAGIVYVASSLEIEVVREEEVGSQ